MTKTRYFTMLALALTVTLGTLACGSAPAPQPHPHPTTGARNGVYTLATSTLRVPANLAQAPYDQPRTVRVPRGWRVEVYARLAGARLMVWTPDKKLLISRPEFGDVQLLAPGKNGAAPTSRALITGLRKPHGLAFQGNRLYIAESNRVTVYPYMNGHLGPGLVVIDNLPDESTAELGGAYAHALKSVAVAADGTVYVSVGSTGNISAEDRGAQPERASILRIKHGKTTVYAHGVRNGTGLAIAPDGAVWTAVNNRDQTAYPYAHGYLMQGQVDARYVNDHPLEPVAKLTPGRDLGWPYCNPDPDLTPGAATTKRAYTNRPFIRDIQLNPTGAQLDCAKLPPVEQGLPAHSAPLGMAFASAAQLPPGWGAGALIGVHGSWNRTPPRPSRVVFFPYKKGLLTHPYALFDGFQNADGSRWGRPVAATVGPDKNVYVTDDLAGAIYRLVPPKR